MGLGGTSQRREDRGQRTEDRGQRTEEREDKMPKVKEPKGPYVPTGKPRGRPKMDPSELKANKPKKVSKRKTTRTGENRGAHYVPKNVHIDNLRGQGSVVKGPYVPTGKPMGRPRLDPSQLKANRKVYQPKGNGKVGVENR